MSEPSSSAFSSPSSPSSAHSIVIVGAGIIGSSIAYYLAERGVRSLIIESVGIAAAASGRAGGFLAKDWNYGSVGKLATRSYALHEDLKEKFNNVQDYRQLNTYSILFGEPIAYEDCMSNEQRLQKMRDVGHPDYIEPFEFDRIGSCYDTAQVHPAKLTKALVQHAYDMAGTEVRIAKVTGVKRDSDKVTHVIINDNEEVPCSHCVFAMGPWTGSALKWLGQPATLISGQRAHSIVLQPAHQIGAQAAFVDGRSESFEIYPRPDGTVYACSPSDAEPLPSGADKVTCDQTAIDVLLRNLHEVAPKLQSSELLHKQACYLPITNSNQPFIGLVPGFANAYVAAGHSCWGILNGPATGKMLAQLILDGECAFMDAQAFSF